MREIGGIRDIAPDFDGFIVDLWGVIHDGVRAYAGAVECLTRLRDAGKPVVLLSNAPRRASVAQRGMRAMGIADDLYAGIITSGEVTHELLATRDDPFFAALGRRMIHVGPEKDRTMFAGLDYELVASAAEAEFILNSGPDDERGPTSLEPFMPLLREAAARKLPMICANPDIEVVRDGRTIMCAGALAIAYEALGGVARYIGKPNPAVYGPALTILERPRERVVAIGDSLRTDIAGARAAGLRSCWVLGGIHADVIAQAGISAEHLAKEAGLAPETRLHRFIW